MNREPAGTVAEGWLAREVARGAPPGTEKDADAEKRRAVGGASFITGEGRRERGQRRGKLAEGSFEKECGTARRGDSGFGTSDKAVQRGGEAVHAFPYAVSGPSGHGRPRSADGHEPSERRVQRIAPDADFRRKMPCEARQAGSVLKPGDEKAHGRVAEPIPDGQQPLAHEGGGIVPVP